MTEFFELFNPTSVQDQLLNKNDPESTSELFFSYREKRWKVKQSYESWGHKKSRFFWTGEVEIWDYPACNISLVRASDNKLKIIVRRKKRHFSTFRGKEVEIRLMIGFDLEKIYEPWEDVYTARKNEGGREILGGPKERFVFQFNDNCWVWEWVKEGETLESSNVYDLYRSIFEEISNPSVKSDNIFDVEDVKAIIPKKENENALKIIPVVYQPAIDSMKNFVRIVDCASYKTVDGYLEIEVSLIFNNEQLRQHSFLNNVYQAFRYYRYGRILDIETFRIRLGDDVKGNKFVFHNIYSEKYGLEYDSIHGDSGDPVPEHDIKYYFNTEEHPVLFINTSNHAMAEYDSNHNLWKWEYIPWLDDGPVVFGEKNRTYIEDEIEEEITKKIENETFLGRYILKAVQKYRKFKRLLSSF
ncbi:hypothetical protein [Methanosarcina acetivorans]|uniref:Uncharacterized protein n=1 Tax=Methanosarcina acetivorans (strain ATCC 35395 / DSM 2834 / JCM 12185 / C2A) TaxID=188937 RepID=Q8TQC2_METAC|nr:hypothetical protein [Methanosarcina acetivorans]AAM05036.1 predicted protein [Methanosarcina acetivorans C2A]